MTKLLTCLTFSLLLPLAARASDDAPVQAQVRALYHWYVHALNVESQPTPLKSPTIHKYVTRHFLKDIARQAKSSGMPGGGLDYDPVIMAQDWDKAWETNIRVKDMEQDGAKWNVQVELSGKMMDAHRLNLVLVEEDGLWKVDKIADGDTR